MVGDVQVPPKLLKDALESGTKPRERPVWAAKEMAQVDTLQLGGHGTPFSSGAGCECLIFSLNVLSINDSILLKTT